ncbi:MAG: porin family protein [Rhodothermales bacterium]|nr:porin family protein [Rhodothermales bacterium]
MPRPRTLLPLAGLPLLALLLAPRPAAAQEWTGGLKLGGTVTTLSGDAASELDPRTGWAGGFSLGYDFGTGLVVRPEVIYAVKGAYADLDVDGIPVRARSTISYAEIPLLVSYRYPHGTLHPVVYAGPMAAFKLDATIRFRARGSDREQTEQDDSVQGFDYGAVVGTGLEWDVGGQRLSIEVRGSFGRANVREAEPPLRNTGAMLLVGVLF